MYLANTVQPLFCTYRCDNIRIIL